MSEYAVLDLFCGLGGFSQSFEQSERWGVTTVDIEARFEPDIQADVFDLRPSDFEQKFDVVLASPPCKTFSIAAVWHDHFEGKRPQTAKARDAVALVHHTLGLVRGLNPAYWFLENPKGKLRTVIGQPTAKVTYCQYGTEYMKPTDLWGDHPAGFIGRSCSFGDGCHNSNTREEHPSAGGLDGELRDPAKRAKVPAELSEAIREACEAGLDGEAPEQTTIDEVIGA